ncbi:hypothetical protein ACQPW1_13240 [Nocardia sp. CA-128927]|uniref:hypothetical protein n=1 Tax=Nocardia sp. CA-128927 TaxID=3239975 RepID=UPI003D9A03A7
MLRIARVGLCVRVIGCRLGAVELRSVRRRRRVITQIVDVRRIGIAVMVTHGVDARGDALGSRGRNAVEGEVEALIGESGSGCGTGDFARDTGRGFRRCRNGGAADARRRDVGGTGQTGAEPRTHRAARGPCGGRDARVFPILGGDFVAVADPHLQDLGAYFQATFFDRLVDGAVQRGPSGSFGRGAGQHAGDQLFDRNPNGDLGGYPQGDGARGTDSGPRGRQQWRHLDREDDHRADDDEFGLLDIGCAVTDLVGETVQILDQTGPGALLPGHLIPVRGDRVVGLAIDGGQRLRDYVSGVIVELVERRRHRRPRIGHAPHRGLVALGPITGPDNPFGDPLQGLRDFDTHQGWIWLSLAALA